VKPVQNFSSFLTQEVIWTFPYKIYHVYNFRVIFPMAQQPPVGQDLLIIEASRSHSDTPHSVGLFWTGNQPVAETSIWQHITVTRDRHPCPRWDSNPQSQQANGCRPTPYTAWLLGSADCRVTENDIWQPLTTQHTSFGSPLQPSTHHLF
jgi:hypothetical protein